MVCQLFGGDDSARQFDVEPKTECRASLARHEDPAGVRRDLVERKGVQGLPHVASYIRLLRAFVIGRMERLEEIIPPMSECLRAVCDLMSDVRLEEEGFESNWVFNEICGQG